jgi:hypothetical protein
MQHKIPENKRCPECGIVKSSGEFHRNSARRDGLTYVCAECIPKYEARDKKPKKNLSNINKQCDKCNRVLPSRMYLYDQNTDDRLRSSCRTCSAYRGKSVPSPDEIREYETFIKKVSLNASKIYDIYKQRSELEHYVNVRLISSGLSKKWKPPVWVHKTSITE